MSWGLIVGGVIAGAGAIMGGQSAADGAEGAAATQAGAASESARLTDAAQKRLEKRMDPYIREGRAADRYTNGFLGLPSGGGAGGSGGGGAPMSEADLRAAYPTLAQQWDNWETYGMHMVGRYGHRDTFGDFAGYVESAVGEQALGQQGEPGDDQADIDAARADGMAAYEQSPWARFARESADKARADANESYMSTAGARGSIVSGRTAAGLYDIAQDAEDQRFREGFTEGYYPSLTGVSQRGYNASVGVGDSSLSSAAQIGAAGERAAGARADGERAAADARANGINSALYYGGQVFDAWQNRAPPPPPPASKAPSTKAPSSKYYGG
jgi:hypothetical protein